MPALNLPTCRDRAAVLLASVIASCLLSACGGYDPTDIDAYVAGTAAYVVAMVAAALALSSPNGRAG